MCRWRVYLALVARILSIHGCDDDGVFLFFEVGFKSARFFSPALTLS